MVLILSTSYRSQSSSSARTSRSRKSTTSSGERSWAAAVKPARSANITLSTSILSAMRASRPDFRRAAIACGMSVPSSAPERVEDERGNDRRRVDHGLTRQHVAKRLVLRHDQPGNRREIEREHECNYIKAEQDEEQTPVLHSEEEQY